MNLAAGMNLLRFTLHCRVSARLICAGCKRPARARTSHQLRQSREASSTTAWVSARTARDSVPERASRQHPPRPHRGPARTPTCSEPPVPAHCRAERVPAGCSQIPGQSCRCRAAQPAPVSLSVRPAGRDVSSSAAIAAYFAELNSKVDPISVLQVRNKTTVQHSSLAKAPHVHPPTPRSGSPERQDSVSKDHIGQRLRHTSVTARLSLGCVFRAGSVVHK